MGLQVRVRHALGERLVDLVDRPVERPLIVGRSREADVKIPSVTVSSEHCALFVHNRQWVLQDTSGGATLVNHVPTEGPTPLYIGDVIVLGNDVSPATIEIDPAGVAQGRSGHPAETHDAAPVAPAVPAARTPANSYAAAPAPATYSSPAPATYPAPAYAATTYAPQAPPQMAAPAPWGHQAAPQEDAFANWHGPASAEPTATLPRRRKASNRMSPMALGIGIAVCVGIVATVIAVAVSKSQKEPDQVVKADTKTTKKGPVSLFGDPGGGSADPGSDAPTPTRKTTPPKKTATETPSQLPEPTADSTPTATPTPDPAARTDPAPRVKAEGAAHKDPEAWAAVNEEFQGSNMGKAILKAEDYRHQHSSEPTKDLDEMIDSALDRLWWTRVGELCKEANDATAALKAKDKEIREETSAAFKKTLLDERKDLETILAKKQMLLNGDMGYTTVELPEIDNAEMMKRLREDRDKDKFANWKQSTLRYIKSHQGKYPWNG